MMFYTLSNPGFFRLMVMLGWLTSCTNTPQDNKMDSPPGVAVLLVDTDRKMGTISEQIYGQFLEHINHSVVDGLYAEQIRGQGFEGDDFGNYWESKNDASEVRIEAIEFKNGEKSVRLEAGSDLASIRQDRIYLQEGVEYTGSLWVKPELGSEVSIKFLDASENLLEEIPIIITGIDWQEINFTFTPKKTDINSIIEIATDGNILVDFVSLMPKSSFDDGFMRPDLVQALKDLNPPFIRWPGGSFASIYKWKDGIGDRVSRKYHPNEIWGGYSDYYGFGTEEFLELCHQLQSRPMIVLNATTTDSVQVQYAMDWVHYLIDPPHTEWGKQRAENGHPDPYDIPYFQIDNEPMNHGLTPDQYAEIVNVYGAKLREIAPQSKIVACGQKRSNDMIWSQKLIDLAGDNFDILGCHNYEYEPENYQTGLLRIRDYLIRLKDYIRSSDHPDIEPTVLEWGLCRSYDWRAGMHAAGSLITYETLGLEQTCPALLMRNTTDDPTWTAWIYHDYKSWFPGAAYVVEKLFHDHYASEYLASTNGTFKDLEEPEVFFNEISQMKPEDWQPGTIDAIASGSPNGDRVVIKAVNYSDSEQVLLTRFQGTAIMDKTRVRLFTIRANPTDAASIESPGKIKPVQQSIPFDKDISFIMEPYSVLVAEVIKD